MTLKSDCSSSVAVVAFINVAEHDTGHVGIPCCMFFFRTERLYLSSHQLPRLLASIVRYSILWSYQARGLRAAWLFMVVGMHVLLSCYSEGAVEAAALPYDLRW